MPSDLATSAEFQRWLRRYGVSNPYEKWQTADTARTPSLALNAIAADADLLQRVPPEDGKLLAHDADLAIGHILLDKAAAARTPGAVEAAEIVKLRIAVWRRRQALENTRELDRLRVADPGRGESRGAMAEAVAHFPLLRPTTARFLVDTTLQLGVHGLIAQGAPNEVVLALGAARVAARSAGGRPPGYGMPRYRVLEVLGIVQGWSVATGRDPFALPGYPGAGDLTRRVAGLALDANACAALAVQLPGGAEAPGYAMWEDAAELHAYALLRMRKFNFSDFGTVAARDVASAGGRLARRAIDDPATVLPLLPDSPIEVAADDPYTVAVAAHTIVGGPFAPRRSALTLAEKKT